MVSAWSLHESDRDPPDPLINCWVAIVGDERFDPDLVTMRTSLVPSFMWRKGDAHVTPTGRKLRDRWTSCWTLETGRIQSLDLPAVLDRLLATVEEHTDAILEIVRESGAEVEVSAHILMSDQAPIGSIPLAMLRRIVALGADFDLDLYVVSDDYLTRSDVAPT